jgi:hypothetical protein
MAGALIYEMMETIAEYGCEGGGKGKRSICMIGNEDTLKSLPISKVVNPTGVEIHFVKLLADYRRLMIHFQLYCLVVSSLLTIEGSGAFYSWMPCRIGPSRMEALKSASRSKLIMVDR